MGPDWGCGGDSVGFLTDDNTTLVQIGLRLTYFVAITWMGYPTRVAVLQMGLYQV